MPSGHHNLRISEADFIRLFEEKGPAGLAKATGIGVRNVYARRRDIERRLNCRLKSPTPQAVVIESHPHRIHLDVPNGNVIVGGDAHYWPGPPSTAHRAFVKFIKELKPKAVIMNGDAFDGASISRHPPIGWAEQPTVQQEIEAVQERLHEVELACPRGCKRLWPLGNHDARFETRIATVAPEYAKVHGTSLRDHFTAWEPCWSAWINDDVVVKHRFKNGLHAPHNNSMWSGKTIVTGHLHSAKVQPITDYNGTRYGVDAGCMADSDARAFLDYTEDSPKNWRSGFCVLTFKDGKLLQPELVLVWDADHVQFRGELIRV